MSPSPLPWREDVGDLWDATDGYVGQVEASDDAAFIVRAVNAHESLVEALLALQIASENYVKYEQTASREDATYRLRQAQVLAGKALANAVGASHAR